MVFHGAAVVEALSGHEEQIRAARRVNALKCPCKTQLG